MTNSISSMTGFARLEGEHDERRWSWELKSVNGRGLEMRCRLPQGFDGLEPDIRSRLRKKLTRGSITVNLAFQSEASLTRFQINESALADAMAMVKKIRVELECDLPRAEGILALRGVMEPLDDVETEEERKSIVGALLTSFEQAVDSLVAARAGEGVAMGAVLSSLLDDIERLTKEAEMLAAAAPEALRAKLQVQISELLSGAPIAEERLAQEAAMLAVKADIREELDRLVSHVGAGRVLLSEQAPVGRQLDFLAQEFNREANTLCSKAQDMALKRVGLELKKTIDQLREQVQNIE